MYQTLFHEIASIQDPTHFKCVIVGLFPDSHSSLTTYTHKRLNFYNNYTYLASIWSIVPHHSIRTWMSL